MYALMIAILNQPLGAIMRKDIFSLHCLIDIQDTANELSKRKYFAAPVVDSKNRIIVIIKVERLIKGIQENITQDIQRMFGVGGDEKPFSNIFFSLNKRLFWLHVDLMDSQKIKIFNGLKILNISKKTLH